MDKENGYYNGGYAVFQQTNFISKIVENFGDLIVIDDIIPEYARNIDTVKLVSGCDKSFTTCCNKFNNAINFRGEPTIVKIEL